MRINKEVDLPEALVSAHRAGRLVIFAGAGISMGSPSNLPDFERLADMISGGTLTRTQGEPLDMFLGKHTGARVQEVVSVRVGDLRLEPPPHVRLFGKGRKERLCPLWRQTAEILRTLLAESGSQPPLDVPLFRNHRGTGLTRFGVRYLLDKDCTLAQAAVPTLAAKRLHPHSMRHSTAVHLLRAGVDIVTISQWLGHASVTTTNRYATVDLETKRKAIEQARPIDHANSALASWRTDASILKWLEAL
jgi:integrase